MLNLQLTKHKSRLIIFLGALECHEGVLGSSKYPRKKGLFSQSSTVPRALYVGNVNRVSNSCKTGLKGYDFSGDLTCLMGVFHAQCKRV